MLQSGHNSRLAVDWAMLQLRSTGRSSSKKRQHSIIQSQNNLNPSTGGLWRSHCTQEHFKNEPRGRWLALEILLVKSWSINTLNQYWNIADMGKPRNVKLPQMRLALAVTPEPAAMDLLDASKAARGLATKSQECRTGKQYQTMPVETAKFETQKCLRSNHPYGPECWFDMIWYLLKKTAVACYCIPVDWRLLTGFCVFCPLSGPAAAFPINSSVLSSSASCLFSAIDFDRNPQVLYGVATIVTLENFKLLSLKHERLLLPTSYKLYRIKLRLAAKRSDGCLFELKGRPVQSSWTFGSTCECWSRWTWGYEVCLAMVVSHPSSAFTVLLLAAEVANFLAAFLACLPARICTLRSLACSDGSSCHWPLSNACKRESLSQPRLVRTSANIWDVSVQIAKASGSFS